MALEQLEKFLAGRHSRLHVMWARNKGDFHSALATDTDIKGNQKS